MTAAEFAEEVLNIELLDYQKEFMDKAYECAQKHQTIICYPPRGSNKYFLKYLQALALIMAGQDEGIIKKEIIRNDKKY